MSDRDMLIELLRDTFEYTKGVCIEFEEAVEINADHLLANGVIVPPCKVGDTVYYELYGEVESAVIYRCEAELTQGGVCVTHVKAKTNDGVEVYFRQDNIGKTVFLSREEAERALKGNRENKQYPSTTYGGPPPARTGRHFPEDVSEKIMKHFTEVE